MVAKSDGPEGAQESIRLSALVAEGNIRELDRNTPEFKELVEDVKTRGILEPVLVRKLPDNGGYQLIAGFRRAAAARAAGLLEIPAVVGTWNDEEVAEIRLVENLHVLNARRIVDLAGAIAELEGRR